MKSRKPFEKEKSEQSDSCSSNGLRRLQQRPQGEETSQATKKRTREFLHKIELAHQLGWTVVPDSESGKKHKFKLRPNNADVAEATHEKIRQLFQK